MGVVPFPAGWYLYTGSALSGLRARVGRHLRHEKRPRWHIDSLLAVGRVIAVTSRVTDERLECDWNRAAILLPGAQVVAPGFGSSDCRCPAHLVYLGAERQPER